MKSLTLHLRPPFESHRLISVSPHTLRENGGLVVWLTGLSGAGKTTIAQAVQQALTSFGVPAVFLDGDEVRKQLHPTLGFSKADREENVRRIGALAKARAEEGAVVLVAVIAPYRTTRQEVRQICRAYLEVFVDAPLQTCEERDPKGLYRRVRRGEITQFTGIDAPYEAPIEPEIHCRTASESIEESSQRVLRAIAESLR